jgi:hypothetical protein
MSENAKRLFDSLAPGLKNMGPELAAELKRLGTQGQMEFASALFNGNAFVPYGPGQYTPSHEPEHQHGQEQELETGRER